MEEGAKPEHGHAEPSGRLFRYRVIHFPGAFDDEVESLFPSAFIRAMKQEGAMFAMNRSASPSAGS